MSTGSIRVVSKRKGGIAALAVEVVIDVDRTNPLLGNRFVLNDHRDDQERVRVIEAYEGELREDIAANGPKSKELDRVAAMVRSGAKVAFSCWCAPRPCHGDPLAQVVAERAGISVTPATPQREPQARQAQLL